jgi:hypothetical protein
MVLAVHEFEYVCPARGGVAVQLDRARVGGLHEVVPRPLQPFDSGADLPAANGRGIDVGHRYSAVAGEQRGEAVVVAHHHRVDVRAYLPYTAASTLGGAKLGAAAFGPSYSVRGQQARPFIAAAGLIAGMAALLALIAARTTVRHDIT